jgi:hypothetical protein
MRDLESSSADGKVEISIHDGRKSLKPRSSGRSRDCVAAQPHGCYGGQLTGETRSLAYDTVELLRCCVNVHIIPINRTAALVPKKVHSQRGQSPDR